MEWPKLYSVTVPTEGLKEGVTEGEEVGADDGADDRWKMIDVDGR